MAAHRKHIPAALESIGRADPVMAKIIAEVGPFGLRLERDRFWMLARSIIAQQISVGAARSIQNRLRLLVSPQSMTPQALLRFTVDELRTCGISRQKATYLLDLASKADDLTIKLKTIGRLTDEEIIEQLTQVKGIGRWTAQMFLIFSLGRLDVFPADDLGIRTAIRNRYGLPELPSKAICVEIARPWQPYSTIASWYCWRSLELS